MRGRYRYGGWFVALFLTVVALGPTSVLASNKRIEVPCWVNSNTISMTVTDGSVAYGIVEVGGAQNTADIGLDDHQTAANTGNEPVKFQIKSSNALVAIGTPWTLGDAVGTDIFTHTASVAAPDTPSWTIAMTVADIYVDLVASVAPGGKQDFDLKIDMPIEITTYAEHTITITVLAVTP